MKKTYLTRIYILGFLFSFHLALTAYVNSTFLETIIPKQYIGLLYGGASLLTILLLSSLSSFLSKIGNRRTISIFIIGNVLALSTFITTQNTTLLTIAFILFLVTNTLVFYCFDIFVEHWSTKESVGRTRGVYLTLLNLAWMLSPLITGTILSTRGYKGLYTIALILGCMVLCLLPFFTKTFTDQTYQKISLKNAFVRLQTLREVRKIVLINFILQFFFALMVVYTPLYLHNTIGFDWKTLGIMFTIMLSPFVLLDLPLGARIDKKGKEVWYLMVGFFVTILAVLGIAFTTATSVILWTALLFVSRVGAAILETVSETYFFKHVAETDIDLLSVFRDMTPLAYIIAPITGSALLIYGSYQIVYIVLTLVLCIGVYITYSLNKKTI